ncbi:MAG: zinc ribbon domain-containing protein [Ruminococcaceae bacterium]|nr:zinc ribbon domain-containing protein [Oscillospiraceae bacterium]
MKRILNVIVVILACLFAIPIVASATQTCDVYEMNLKVELPDEMLFFMRNVQEDDPSIKYLPYSREDILANMRTNSMYLLGYTEDYEIQIKMQPSEISSLAALSDADFQDLSNGMHSRNSELGITLYSSEAYTVGGVKYIVDSIKYSAGNTPQYSVQYVTIVDRKMIRISIVAYNGNVSVKQRAIIKNVVDSAKYTAINQPSQSGTSGSSVNTTPKEDAVSTSTDLKYYIFGVCGVGVVALVFLGLRKKKSKREIPLDPDKKEPSSGEILTAPPEVSSGGNRTNPETVPHIGNTKHSPEPPHNYSAEKKISGGNSCEVNKSAAVVPKAKTVEKTAAGLGGSFNYQFTFSALKDAFFADTFTPDKLQSVTGVEQIIKSAVLRCQAKGITVPKDYYQILNPVFVASKNKSQHGVILSLNDASLECEVNYIGLIISNGKKHFYTSEYFTHNHSFGLCMDDGSRRYSLAKTITGMESIMRAIGVVISPPANPSVEKSNAQTVHKTSAPCFCSNCGKKYIASDSTFCAYCGSELAAPPEEKKPIELFCRKCGSKLIPGSVFCHKCGMKHEQVGAESTPLCKKCGGKLVSSDKYCRYCGNQVREEPRQIDDLSDRLSDSPSMSTATPIEEILEDPVAMAQLDKWLRSAEAELEEEKQKGQAKTVQSPEQPVLQSEEFNVAFDKLSDDQKSRFFPGPDTKRNVAGVTYSMQKLIETKNNYETLLEIFITVYSRVSLFNMPPERIAITLQLRYSSYLSVQEMYNIIFYVQRRVQADMSGTSSHALTESERAEIVECAKAYLKEISGEPNE